MKSRVILAVLAFSWVLSACGKKEDAPEKPLPTASLEELTKAEDKAQLAQEQLLVAQSRIEKLEGRLEKLEGDTDQVKDLHQRVSGLEDEADEAREAVEKPARAEKKPEEEEKPARDEKQVASEEASEEVEVSPPVPEPEEPEAEVETAPAQGQQPAQLMDDPEAPLSLTQMIFAQDIDRKERLPINPSTTFPGNLEKVYVYLVFRNQTEEERKVMVHWKRDGVVKSEIELRVGPDSKRWRTWGYQNIRPKHAGQWEVEITDTDGKTLGSGTFVVTSDSSS